MLCTRRSPALPRDFAKEQRRIGLRKAGKVLRLAAVIMGISVLLFTSAFALSEDFRGAKSGKYVRYAFSTFKALRDPSDLRVLEIRKACLIALWRRLHTVSIRIIDIKLRISLWKYGEVSITLADLENDLYIGVDASSGLSVDTTKKIAENILIL